MSIVNTLIDWGYKHPICITVAFCIFVLTVLPAATALLGFLKFVLKRLVFRPLQSLFDLPHRFFRYLAIRKHGWPPEHCDADGDST